MKPVLASTLHDPQNRLESLIKEQTPKLEELFHEKIVTLSSSTSRETLQTLQKLGYEASYGDKSVASTYVIALRRATEKNAEPIFYCDFDRLLHWASCYPEELEAATQESTHDFTLFGRTKRAMLTHPETQILTETTVNILASKILGFRETRDVLGTTWMLKAQQAEALIGVEISNQYGFYTDWPIRLWSKSANPAYIEVEGLEWETPDRYRQEIAEAGYVSWRESYQNVQEWRKRNLMLRGMIEAIITRIHLQKST